MSNQNPLGRPIVASAKTEAKGPNSGTEYCIKFHTYNKYETYERDLIHVTEVIIEANGDKHVLKSTDTFTKLGDYGLELIGTIDKDPKIEENTPIVVRIIFSKSMIHKTTTNYNVRPI